MSFWFDIIVKFIWPVASTLTPVVFAVGVLWLRSQFPTKSDFDDLHGRVGKLEKAQSLEGLRISQLAQENEGSPTRIELLDKLNMLSTRLAHVEAGTKAIEKMIATQNDYLHTLIERGLK